MNRIYQGRVCGVEKATQNKGEFKPLNDDPKEARRLGEEMLWLHHALFQDAVNYWAFALAEMARGMTQKNDKGEDKPAWMAKFAEQVRGRWDDFTHKGTKREGLKYSLHRTLEIPLSEITWEKCAEKIFAAVLAKYPGRRDKDGNDVLHGVIGELFRAGRGLAPKNMANEDPSWLCWRDKREKENTPAAAYRRKTLGIAGFMDELFWADATRLKDVAQLALADTALTSVVSASGTESSSDESADEEAAGEETDDDKLDPKVFFFGAEAVAELEAYFNAAQELLKDPVFARDFRLLGGDRFDACAEFARIGENIAARKQLADTQPDALHFQRWKKQGPKERDRDRVKLFILFQFDSGSEFMGAMLRARLLRRKDSYIEHLHGTDKALYVEFVERFGLCGSSEGQEPKEKVQAARDAIAKEEGVVKKQATPPTDLIKLLRTTVGYVFPSFTAIRGFVADDDQAGACRHGELGWTKFDNSAYEEAVKAPHQMQKKDKERREELKDIEALEKLYVGNGRKTGKGDDGEDEDRIPGGFKDDRDPRFAAMERIRAALRVEDGIEEGEFHEYTISEAALRGYDELRIVWNKAVEKGELFSRPKADKLKQLLKEHQAEHRDDMGAARLFEEFLKEGNWCVWQNELDEIEKERAAKNWSDNFVRDYQRYVEVVAKRKKKEKPIQYTPADAAESRRLFDFKGGAGLKHAEKEGTLSFTTQIAVEQADGLYRAQDVRIVYTAPRLLRDEARVLSENEDLKSANWAQPMMRALGVPDDSRHDFKTHAVSLMPHWHPGSHSSTPDRLLLNFVLMPNEEKFVASLRKKMGRATWTMQFNWNRDKNESTLRWPHEDWSKVANKDGFPGRWFAHPELTTFRLLAVDLGQKQADAYALIEVSCRYSDEEKRQARFIGRTELNGESRDWYARVVLTGLHKLPGEDADVLRPEFANGKPVPGTKDFRQELSGSAGRNATEQESEIAFKYLVDLEQLDLLNDGSRMTKTVRAALADNERSAELMEWRTKARELVRELSVPDQNTKMLIALRRARTFANRLHRWCWFLAPTNEERKDADERRRTAIKEMAEADEHPWLDKGAHDLAKMIHKQVEEAQKAGEKLSVSGDARIIVPLKSRLETLAKQLPGFLEVVANRIYASRKGCFMWGKNPDKDDCHLLDFVEFTKEQLEARKAISKDEKRLAGQRGLSMERIEQLEELRKICQSLNQTLRRPIGEKPPISRDDSIPDPCPKILAKLDEIKEQRRNQTAHMILSEALGLKLKEHSPVSRAKLMRMNLSVSALSLIENYPASAKRRAAERLSQTKARIEKRISKRARRWSLHGEYAKVDGKGRVLVGEDPEAWRGIVDFIVIEDLSRYRTSQGRAPRENSRLMKWCHRAIRDKLKEMCAPFGMPLIETPAAYSSRFCSRTGVAGFRAAELSAASLEESKWRWKTRKPEDEAKEKDEAKKRRGQWESLFEAVQKANEGRDGQSKGQKYRTLLVPEAGGSIFVPMADLDEKHERPPKDPKNLKKQRPIIRYLPVQLDDGQAKEPRLIHSDVNGAVCVGLRAVANPRTWSIHSRLRSERESDAPPKPRNKTPKKQRGAQPPADPPPEVKPDRFYVADSEKRKFRPREKPKGKAPELPDVQTGQSATPQADTRIRIELKDQKKADLKPSESHHPNFFADVARLRGAFWGAAELKGLESDETAPLRLVSSKALWGFVKQQAWHRCLWINAKRLQAWGIQPPAEWLLQKEERNEE